ncbi:AAA family ATPase [Thermoproteus tenax]|uniref:MoxR-like ATPase n=1 Tax=Thermoproteus tenax (strain ATCC 35583 / DSM 2078 / JCM 9277 / NBRC 100435 / Kra 1) TaxID=768679 RepID=G4RPN2_THETK|nr:AAA family ATPase [Thermoproteus tenax]CCC81527.1 MoxR-like ATPase [Thermoproteus tenax Kra 1]
MEVDALIKDVSKVRQYLNVYFYKFSDEITGALIAILSRENYIMIGPPGTAKTMLVASLSKLLKARWFYRLLTKFTELEEIIGPIDVVELLKGNVKRIYANSIVEADVALLDEIFNASSAILNTLLTILNERVIFDGGAVVPVKTWTVFGASNRVPDEEELQALYDRFPLRTFTKYASPEETEDLLRTGLALRQEYERMIHIMTMDDIKKINEYINKIVYENSELLVKHVSPLIAAYLDHVVISNRTRVKVPIYVMAYLTILGIKPSDMDASSIRAATIKVLKYLVHDKEDLSEYEAFVSSHMPGNLSTLYDLINEIKALIANNALTIAREKLREAEELMDKAYADPTLYKFFQTEMAEIKDALSMLRSQL